MLLTFDEQSLRLAQINYNMHIMSQSVIWLKYFKSRLIYFHEPEASENKA